MRFNILGKDIFIWIVTILYLSACASTDNVSAPPTLKIGLIAPFEGLHRPLGYEALFGVKLALQERNLTEGVGGYRIELVALNDFDDPSEAERQAQALLADPEVMGVIGHLSAATTQAALPLYQQAGLPVVIPWSARPMEAEYNGAVSIAANLAVTQARLETLGRELGYNAMTTLTEPNPALLPAEGQAFSLHLEGVSAGETLLALGQADRVWPVLGQVDSGSPQMIQVARTAADGFIFISPGPDPGQMAEASEFVEAYQALAGFPPGPRAVLAYDATQILLEAIEQSLDNHNPPTRAGVSAFIAGVQQRGLSGDIAFNRQGERINAPVWVYQITDGAYPGELFAP